MKLVYFYSFFSLIINFFLFKKYKFLTECFNIYDLPDFKRKLHKTKISAVGGTILIINIILSFIFFYYTNLNFLSSLNFNTFLNSFYFLIFLISLYLVGLMDDKFNLNAATKIIFFSFLSYLTIITNDLFLVKNLRFEYFNKVIDLNHFAIVFSTLSIVIAINAFNMYDGINLQSSTYFLILFTTFLFFNFSYINLGIIFFLIFFIYYNNNNFMFLGNSGVYILGLICSITLIHMYNKNNLFVEDILVFLLLPILDFIRLFFLRIKKNKNPMIGDKLHIQHIMIKKFSNLKVICLLNFFLISVLFLKFIVNLNFFVILFLVLIFYFYLIKE